MNCSQFERELARLERLSSSELSAAAREHARQCARCGAILAVLTRPLPPVQPPASLIGNLERTLVSDLRPVRPLPPPGVLALLFAAICAISATLGVLRFGPFAMDVMSGAMAATIIGSVALVAGATSVSLAGQMFPGGRRHVRPEWLSPAAILLLLAVFLVVFPTEQVDDFWRAAWRCGSSGALVAAPAGLLTWTVLRRGSIASPVVTGATAGLVAGLAGTLMLEIHCPLLAISHELVGHLAVAAIASAIGAGIGALSRLAAKP